MRLLHLSNPELEDLLRHRCGFEKCFRDAQGRDVFFDVMHPQDIRPAFAQQRGESNGRREAIAHFGRANHFAEGRFARNADHERPVLHPEPREIGEQLEIVLNRFAKSDSRIKRDGHGINAAL